MIVSPLMVEEKAFNPRWELVDTLFDRIVSVVNGYRNETQKKYDYPLQITEIDMVIWKMELLQKENYIFSYLKHSLDRPDVDIKSLKKPSDIYH